MNYLNYHTGRPRFHFQGEPPPPTPPTPPTPPPPAPAWHEGIEPETLGFWQNKGYDVTSPKALAAKLTEQYRNLEKHIGAPPDQILRLPKADATPAEKAAFRQRLGWPAEAKDYDFSTVKDAAGQPIAAPLADALRASFHANGIAKDAAPAVALDVIKALDSVKTTETTIAAAARAEARVELEKDWGGKDSATYRFNLLQAKEGAARLGLDPAAVDTLENQMGFAKVMNALRKIGNARREDVFVENDVPGSGRVTTREGAMSRKAELFADAAWVKRLNAGDVEAKAEWKKLNMMIEGDA
jgi:hypothetical protein